MNEKFDLIVGKHLPENEFSRVHAILVMPDERILVRRKLGEVRVTGGHVDPGDKNLEEALKREILEELNCKIDKISYVGYINYTNLDTGETEKMARMVARVSEILPARPDPDRKNNWIYGREILPVKIARAEFVKSAPLGNTAELVDACMKVARQNGFFIEPENQKAEIINVESFDEEL